MDYSDPPRRQRPPRYPGLVPQDDRRGAAQRAPWDDEPFPADTAGYSDTFNGAPTDAFSAGFSDGFGRASTATFGGGFSDTSTDPSGGGFGGRSAGGRYQAPATGGFYEPSAGGGFYQPSAGGGFYEPSAGGGFYEPSATGGFYEPSATGGLPQAGSVDDIRPPADGLAKQRRSAVEWLASGAAGFLSAAVAIGMANLTAAFVRPQASPIIAVGGAFIDRTPPALKNFAVEKFGENDKNMLLLGMYVTIALIAIVIGMLAWRRVSIGMAGIGLFGLFGAFVAFTRPESHVTDVIPSIVGGIVGVAAIYLLVREGTRRTRYGSQAPQDMTSYQTRTSYQKGWGA